MPRSFATFERNDRGSLSRVGPDRGGSLCTTTDRASLSRASVGKGSLGRFSVATDVSASSAATRHWVNSVSDIYGPDEIEELLQDLNRLELTAFEKNDYREFDIDGSLVSGMELYTGVVPGGGVPGYPEHHHHQAAAEAARVDPPSPALSSRSWDSHTHYQQFKITSVACFISLLTAGTAKISVSALPHIAKIRLLIVVSVFSAFFSVVVVFLNISHLHALLPMDYGKMQFVIYLVLGVLFLIASSMMIHAVASSQEYQSWIPSHTNHSLIASLVLGYASGVEAILCSAESLRSTRYQKIVESSTNFTLKDMETSRAVTSETIAGSRHLPNSYPHHPPRPNPPPAPRPIVRSKAERSGLTLTNKNYVATPEPPSPYSSSIAQHHLTDNGGGGGRQLAVTPSMEGGGDSTTSATAGGVPDHRQYSRSAARLLAKRSASPDDLSLYSPRTSRSHTPDDLFCKSPPPGPAQAPPLRYQLPRSAGADRLSAQFSHSGGGAVGNGNGGVTPVDDDRYGSDWRHHILSGSVSPGDHRLLLHYNGENSKQLGDQKDRYFPPDSPVRDLPTRNGQHSSSNAGGGRSGRHHATTDNKKFTKTRKKVNRQQSSDYNSDHDNSSWDSRHAVDLAGLVPNASQQQQHPATLHASRPASTTTNHKDWRGDRSTVSGAGGASSSSQRLRPSGGGKGLSKSSGASPVDPTSDFSSCLLPSEATGAIPKKRTRPLADDLPGPNHPDAIIALPLDDAVTPTSSVSTSRNYNNYAHS